MKKILPLLPYLLGWGLLLSTFSLFEVSLANGIAQLILFLFVVCIPAWKTQRMSYVDIGWPWGLVLIGVMTLLYSEGNWLRVSIVAAAYIFMGLRMGLGALKLWKMGYLNEELPRYKYQHRRWDIAGYKDKRFVMQVEVLLQGLANAAFLAMPAFVIGSNSGDTLSMFEVAGMLIWLLAFLIESVSDVQKLSFLKSMRSQGLKNKVCNVGLWRYSRHPNYFAEWMVWNALLIASVPSWLSLQKDEYSVVWLLLGVALLFVSRIMYVTLVHYTGAKPAEYYSIKKRPEYKQYQQTTNMFFPGKPKV
jgi:steroid 5-alpha reductase family enzyme